MKLKYYMRGMGAGIAVTVVLLSFFNKPETLTDAEIKARASQLGMIEEGVLEKVEKEETQQSEEKKEPNESKDENIDEYEQDRIEDITDNNQEIQEQKTAEVDDIVNNEGQKPVSSQQDILNGDEMNLPVDEVEGNIIDQKSQTVDISSPISNELVENYVIIVIETGNAAQTVSQKMQEAGLIESAKDYDEYLSLNGYSKKLRVGQHEVPMGASYEQMARILCELD